MHPAIVGILALSAAAAQADRQAQLKQKRDQKLAERWITLAEWIPDYDRARARSKASGKPIFAYFTRSYEF
jgi:hypothetical protein